MSATYCTRTASPSAPDPACAAPPRSAAAHRRMRLAAYRGRAERAGGRAGRTFVRGRASATPGAQDDVGDVRVIGWRVDARLDRVQLNREFVAQQPDKA